MRIKNVLNLLPDTQTLLNKHCPFVSQGEPCMHFSQTFTISLIIIYLLPGDLFNASDFVFLPLLHPGPVVINAWLESGLQYVVVVS